MASVSTFSGQRSLSRVLAAKGHECDSSSSNCFLMPTDSTVEDDEVESNVTLDSFIVPPELRADGVGGGGVEAVKVAKAGKRHGRRIAVSSDKTFVVITSPRIGGSLLSFGNFFKKAKSVSTGSDRSCAEGDNSNDLFIGGATRRIYFPNIDRIQRGQLGRKFELSRQKSSLHTPATADTSALPSTAATTTAHHEEALSLSIVYRLPAGSSDDVESTKRQSDFVTNTFQTLDLIVTNSNYYAVLCETLEQLLRLHKVYRYSTQRDVLFLQHHWIESSHKPHFGELMSASEWASLCLDRLSVPFKKSAMATLYREHCKAIKVKPDDGLTLAQCVGLLQQLTTQTLIKDGLDPETDEPCHAVWCTILKERGSLPQSNANNGEQHLNNKPLLSGVTTTSDYLGGILNSTGGDGERTYLDPATGEDVLTASDYLAFLRIHQKEKDVSLNQVRDLFGRLNGQTSAAQISASNGMSRQPDSSNSTVSPSRDYITKLTFCTYLKSDVNDLFNPTSGRVGEHDMSQPLSSYWINSSHDTYLRTLPPLITSSSGDFEADNSRNNCDDSGTVELDSEMYTAALYRGCRCLDLDVWDGQGKQKGEPVVRFGLTSEERNENNCGSHKKAVKEGILVSDIARDIRHFIKTNPETFPIILMLENHCSLDVQEKLAFHLLDILETENMLHVPPKDHRANEDTSLPSPLSLRGKVVIKCKRPADMEGGANVIYDDYDDENDINPYSTDTNDRFEYQTEDDDDVKSYAVGLEGVGSIISEVPHRVEKSPDELLAIAEQEAEASKKVATAAESLAFNAEVKANRADELASKLLTKIEMTFKEAENFQTDKSPPPKQLTIIPDANPANDNTTPKQNKIAVSRSVSFRETGDPVTSDSVLIASTSPVVSRLTPEKPKITESAVATADFKPILKFPSFSLKSTIKKDKPTHKKKLLKSPSSPTSLRSKSAVGAGWTRAMTSPTKSKHRRKSSWTPVDQDQRDGDDDEEMLNLSVLSDKSWLSHSFEVESNHSTLSLTNSKDTTISNSSKRKAKSDWISSFKRSMVNKAPWVKTVIPQDDCAVNISYEGSDLDLVNTLSESRETFDSLTTRDSYDRDSVKIADAHEKTMYRKDLRSPLLALETAISRFNLEVSTADHQTGAWSPCSQGMEVELLEHKHDDTCFHKKSPGGHALLKPINDGAFESFPSTAVNNSEVSDSKMESSTSTPNIVNSSGAVVDNHSNGDMMAVTSKDEIEEEGMEIKNVLAVSVETARENYAAADAEVVAAKKSVSKTKLELQKASKELSTAQENLIQAKQIADELAARSTRFAAEARANREHADIAKQRIETVRALLNKCCDQAATAETVAATATTEAKISEQRALEAEGRAAKAQATADSERAKADTETLKQDELEQEAARLQQACREATVCAETALKERDAVNATLEKLDEQRRIIERSPQYNAAQHSTDDAIESCTNSRFLNKLRANAGERKIHAERAKLAVERSANAEMLRRQAQKLFDEVAHKAKLQAKVAASARKQADHSTALAEQLAECAEEERGAADMRHEACERADARVQKYESHRASMDAQLAEAERASVEACETALMTRSRAEKLAVDSEKANDTSKLQALVENKKKVNERATVAYTSAVEVLKIATAKAIETKKSLDTTAEVYYRAKLEHLAEVNKANAKRHMELNAVKAYKAAKTLKERAAKAKHDAALARSVAADKVAAARHAADYRKKKSKVKEMSRSLAKLSLTHRTKYQYWEKSLALPFEHMHSLSEGRVMQLAQRDESELGQWREFNKHHMTRTYPSRHAQLRATSRNFNPVVPWAMGCQLVSINNQVCDAFLLVNDGRFRENGTCGYVLKPSHLTELRWRATQTSSVAPFVKLDSDKTSTEHEIWNIKVLSGYNLPKSKKKATSGQISPRVRIALYDDGFDAPTVYTTKTVKKNGLNPVWNSEKENGSLFLVSCPSVAVMLISLWDSDESTGTDDFIAASAIPVSCLREGYRSVPLFDSNHTRSGLHAFSSLFVKASRQQ